MILKRKNVLQGRDRCEPAKERCDRDGRKVVGDLDLGDSDDIGSKHNDDQGASAGHLCNGRGGQNRSQKAGAENKKSLKTENESSGK